MMDHGKAAPSEHPRMYSTLGRAPTYSDSAPAVANDDGVSHVHPSPADVQDLTELYSTLSRAPDAEEEKEDDGGVHKEFSDFLCKEQNRTGGLPRRRLAVSFRDLTTWGIDGGNVRAKTFVDALWRTLVMRDIYEWTIRPLVRKPKREECRALIRGVSGAVRDGEMMLYVFPSQPRWKSKLMSGE